MQKGTLNFVMRTTQAMGRKTAMILQEDHACYLFNCGTPSKCNFSTHEGFTSMGLTGGFKYEAMMAAKKNQHAEDLANLAVKTTMIATTTTTTPAPTKPPKKQPGWWADVLSTSYLMLCCDIRLEKDSCGFM